MAKLKPASEKTYQKPAQEDSYVAGTIASAMAERYKSLHQDDDEIDDEELEEENQAFPEELEQRNIREEATKDKVPTQATPPTPTINIAESTKQEIGKRKVSDNKTETKNLEEQKASSTATKEPDKLKDRPEFQDAMEPANSDISQNSQQITNDQGYESDKEENKKKPSAKTTKQESLQISKQHDSGIDSDSDYGSDSENLLKIKKAKVAKQQKHVKAT